MKWRAATVLGAYLLVLAAGRHHCRDNTTPAGAEAAPAVPEYRWGGDGCSLAEWDPAEWANPEPIDWS